ncbi:hypothetical protein ACJX0J_007240, partial [Zea mays]
QAYKGVAIFETATSRGLTLKLFYRDGHHDIIMLHNCREGPSHFGLSFPLACNFWDVDEGVFQIPLSSLEGATISMPGMPHNFGRHFIMLIDIASNTRLLTLFFLLCMGWCDAHTYGLRF